MLKGKDDVVVDDTMPESFSDSDVAFTSNKAVEDKPSMYKGYDIKWLKSVKDEHPDGNLVNEYESKFGEVN